MFLLVVLFMFGCAQETAQSEDAPADDAPATDVPAADEQGEKLDEVQGDSESPGDPMITFIRTRDGESETSKVRISSLHLSDFPAPNINSPKDVWDESVSFEVIWDGDRNTQVLSYRTKASSDEYIVFFRAELSDATIELQGAFDTVRGKNEFGDDVEMQYTYPASDDGYAHIRITAQG